MSRFNLHLLGSFQLVREAEQVIDFRSEKERALFAYLALEANRPHSRDVLAGLLWPDLPGDTANNNLRVTLHRVRQVIGDPDAAHPLLEVSREAIQLKQNDQVCTDVLAFQEFFTKAGLHLHEQLETCRECMACYAQAAALYRGEFLHGLYPADSLPFSEWALLKREHLHSQALRALHLLTDHHQRRGELDLALGYARRQLELEPWREEAHCQVMTILALRGERSAALRQYERCRQVLAQELGVEPAEETRALHERILASRMRRRHNLPLHTTPFLGRKSELNQVIQYLANSDCRLLTILGPGGIGKSRLAVQAAEMQAYTYLHGTFLVQLAGVTAQEDMIRAIAGALNFQFYAAGEPKLQLLNYLRGKEMLLVLDNFESLFGAGAPFNASILEELIAKVPGLHLLVTSRQRLNLSWERVVVLRGLSYPEDISSENPESYEAVQLFIHKAQRIAPNFQPDEEMPSIVRTCQLLNGVPLAIELAASWIRVMSPEQVALEIESGLDFLSNSYPDLPERHRSLRATFEHSYNLLAIDEQQALCRLSIFPVSFDRSAAQVVAGASLAVVTALTDRSLLEPIRVHNHGSPLRYRMHELIKHYSREKLTRDTAQHKQTEERHRSFYMKFLNERNTRVMGGKASYVSGQEASSEIENIRLAVYKAIEMGNISELGSSLNILMYIYEIFGLFEEAERIFGEISQRMEEAFRSPQDTVELSGGHYGRALMYHGWYCFRLAHFDRAIELTQMGLVMSRHYDDLEGYGLGLNSLGVFAMEQGKYQQAKGYLQDALKAVSENGYTWTQASVIGNLGLVVMKEGDLPHATELLHQSLELYTQLDDEWGMANVFDDLGTAALRQGNFVLAEKRIRQSLEVRQKLGQRWRVADSLNKLGRLAYQRQQYADAKRLYQEGLTILWDFGERARIASTLVFYGEVCARLGENTSARESLLSALKLAREIGADGTALRALLGMAALLAIEGEREQSVEILAALSGDSSLEHDDQKRVENLLAELQADLPWNVFQAALETGKMLALEDLVKNILRSDR